MAFEDQLRLLRRGPRAVRLVRPCTLGDGIRRFEDPERLEAAFADAVAAGEVTGFVPASGAATRMLAGLAPGNPAVDRARELALWSSLPAADDVAAAILARWSDTPKGLVPFHHTPEGPRTAFEEHLVEAARLLRDRDGVVRVHFTVGAEHEGAFRQALDDARARLEPRLGVRFLVDFSTQDPATDTIAIDESGEPVRDGDRLLTRPGGHGALLGNLQALRSPIAMVKNIDNVVPDRLRDGVVRARARLGGLLVALLRDAPLDRPTRVCGMVLSDGQPGGGPFWVEGRDEPQIVESAQVDHADPAQEAVWQASTHFNPVDMALALRDRDGRPFDLGRYTDPEAAIVTRKTHAGRPITVLEHPGLWNGGMAGWRTIFVEIPREVFQPVKTLADLLGEGHRA